MMWSSDYRLAKSLLDQRLNGILREVETERIAEAVKETHTPALEIWHKLQSMKRTLANFMGRESQGAMQNSYYCSPKDTDVCICDPVLGS